MSDIDLLAAHDRSGTAGSEPRLNFGQIPNDAARRERKPAWKLTTLLHAKDGAVGQRHHFLELFPPDCSGVASLLGTNHLARLNLSDCGGEKANVTRQWKTFLDGGVVWRRKTKTRRSYRFARSSVIKTVLSSADRTDM